MPISLHFKCLDIHKKIPNSKVAKDAIQLSFLTQFPLRFFLHAGGVIYHSMLSQVRK